MKRLAWWAVGLGLGMQVVAVLRAHIEAPGSGPDMAWADAFFDLTQLGLSVFLGGALLLSATVIADAITRAQGTREGP